VLNGELPEALESGGKTISKKRRHKKSKPSVADGVRQLFVGLGFLFVAIILAFQNQPWWVWMLIPAFSILGNGASTVVRARFPENPNEMVTGNTGAIESEANRPRALFDDNKPGSTFVEPLSVTEGTTRHLGSNREIGLPGIDRNRETAER